MYEHETFEHNGLTVRIMADDFGDSGNPREWDNLGVLLMVGGAAQDGYGDEPGRFTIPEWYAATNAAGTLDERGLGKEAFARWARMNLGATVVLPVYLTTGSYAMIRAGALSDERPCAGFIFDTARTRELTGAPVESIERQLEGEVAEYDAYLHGDVVGFEVVRKQTCNLGHIHEEVLDSCWGFLVVDRERDMEYVRSEARAAGDCAQVTA